MPYFRLPVNWALMGRVGLAWAVLAWAVLACVGCGTWWSETHRTPNYKLPQRLTIYLAVNERVARTDDGGIIAAMVEALEDDLREEGYAVQVLGARLGEKPPVPRIELQVTDTTPENGKLRGAGELVGIVGGSVVTAGGLAGGGMVVGASGRVVVECYVVTGPNHHATFAGRLAAHSWGTTTGRDSVSAGERAGHEIASELMAD
ncbi:MAG TPA: hypothetical protein VFQ61_04100 [Polyangiaceae bacterium]|nr:hypothetical protein [Polyangiaceae bacterium]